MTENLTKVYKQRRQSRYKNRNYKSTQEFKLPRRTPKGFFGFFYVLDRIRFTGNDQIAKNGLTSLEVKVCFLGVLSAPG